MLVGVRQPQVVAGELIEKKGQRRQDNEPHMQNSERGDLMDSAAVRKSRYKRPRRLDASLVTSNKRFAASTKNLSAPLGIPFHLADRNRGRTTAPLRFIIR
jgi:hypothetical protein